MAGAVTTSPAAMMQWVPLPMLALTAGTCGKAEAAEMKRQDFLLRGAAQRLLKQKLTMAFNKWLTEASLTSHS